MWEAAIQCTCCESVHVVKCADSKIPRVYAYVCPDADERVVVRYRDPSRIERDWMRVERAARGAIATEATSSRGAFEV